MCKHVAKPQKQGRKLEEPGRKPAKKEETVQKPTGDRLGLVISLSLLGLALTGIIYEDTKPISSSVIYVTKLPRQTDWSPRLPTKPHRRHKIPGEKKGLTLKGAIRRLRSVEGRINSATSNFSNPVPNIGEHNPTEKFPEMIGEVKEANKVATVVLQMLNTGDPKSKLDAIRAGLSIKDALDVLNGIWLPGNNGNTMRIDKIRDQAYLSLSRFIVKALSDPDVRSRLTNEDYSLIANAINKLPPYMLPLIYDELDFNSLISLLERGHVALLPYVTGHFVGVASSVPEQDVLVVKMEPPSDNAQWSEAVALALKASKQYHEDPVKQSLVLWQSLYMISLQMTPEKWRNIIDTSNNPIELALAITFKSKSGETNSISKVERTVIERLKPREVIDYWATRLLLLRIWNNDANSQFLTPQINNENASSYPTYIREATVARLLRSFKTNASRDTLMDWNKILTGRAQIDSLMGKPFVIAGFPKEDVKDVMNKITQYEAEGVYTLLKKRDLDDWEAVVLAIKYYNISTGEQIGYSDLNVGGDFLSHVLDRQALLDSIRRNKQQIKAMLSDPHIKDPQLKKALLVLIDLSERYSGSSDAEIASGHILDAFSGGK